MKFPAPYYMALALSVNVAYFMSMADGGYEALAMKERMISFLPSFLPSSSSSPSSFFISVLLRPVAHEESKNFLVTSHT
jgi:hypothetical protein